VKFPTSPKCFSKIGPVFGLTLVSAFFLSAEERILDSGPFPQPNQQGGEYLLPELSLHALESEKVLNVPAAYWRGGCLPTAVAMVLMYWESQGLVDLLPSNEGFHFNSSRNIEQIASSGHYGDYYYPLDTSDNILPDRSEDDPSTWRAHDSVGDVLRSSFSRYRMPAGATSSWAPLDYLPNWVSSRNAHYSLDVDLDSSRNYWPRIVSEIDAGRPLIAYVNSTRGSSVEDHALTVVGYGQDGTGTRYYLTLNTWDYSVHRYQYGLNTEMDQWGISDLVTMNISEQAPLAMVSKFYNPTSGAYFFSANGAEVNEVKTNNPAWNYIGTAFQVEMEPASNNVPVYRFYNQLAASHFYTANHAEYESVKANLSHYLHYEGIAFFVRAARDENTYPVYRFYIHKTASHFFTVSEAEKNAIIANQDPSVIQYEGIAWFSRK